MESRRRLLILVLPTAVLLSVFFLLPLFYMAGFSFREGSFGADRAIFTLRHYQEFFSSPAYINLLLRSVILSFWISLLTIVLAYPIAYYLSFNAGNRKLLLLTIIIVPAWVSYLLRVLAWKVILGGDGVLASLLVWLGISAEGTAVLLYSPEAVIITLVYVWIPFVALPIFAALERIDPYLLEAAYDLGSSRLQAFLQVTLPLSLPGLIAGFLFVFIPTVGEYVTPALVGGPEGVMFGNIVRDQFVRALNWPLGSLMSLVMLLVVLLPLLVLGRFIHFSDLAEA